MYVHMLLYYYERYIQSAGCAMIMLGDRMKKNTSEYKGMACRHEMWTQT